MPSISSLIARFEGIIHTMVFTLVGFKFFLSECPLFQIFSRFPVNASLKIVLFFSLKRLCCFFVGISTLRSSHRTSFVVTVMIRSSILILEGIICIFLGILSERIMKNGVNS